VFPLLEGELRISLNLSTFTFGGVDILTQWAWRAARTRCFGCRRWVRTGGCADSKLIQSRTREPNRPGNPTESVLRFPSLLSGQPGLRVSILAMCILEWPGIHSAISKTRLRSEENQLGQDMTVSKVGPRNRLLRTSHRDASILDKDTLLTETCNTLVMCRDEEGCLVGPVYLFQ
jgi:hypothetical protein